MHKIAFLVVPTGIRDLPFSWLEWLIGLDSQVRSAIGPTGEAGRICLTYLARDGHHHTAQHEKSERRHPVD